MDWSPLEKHADSRTGPVSFTTLVHATVVLHESFTRDPAPLSGLTTNLQRIGRLGVRPEPILIEWVNLPRTKEAPESREPGFLVAQTPAA